MNDMSPSIESIVQMSDVSRARFNCINSFARAHNITISGLYFYVAIGALNIEKLSGEQVIYSAVKPPHAALPLCPRFHSHSRLVSTARRQRCTHLRRPALWWCQRKLACWQRFAQGRVHRARRASRRCAERHCCVGF